MTRFARVRSRIDVTVDGLPASRLAALAGAVGLMVSFLVVLYDVVDTVGEPLLFYPIVLVPLLAATILARIVTVRTALTIAATLFVGGSLLHFLTLSASFEPLVLVSNNVELLTGRTVLRIKQADVWAMTLAPTPVFVTWYLALRRQYVGAALAGGAMLGYLVLTGDAGTFVTLLGVVSVGTLVAFGDIESTGWSGAADQATLVLVVMVLAPLLITVVPGGAASPVTFLDDRSTTMEDNVVSSEAELDILGSIEQTGEPRYIITSEEPRLWRTGSYDRYTGDGWVQTDEARPYAETRLGLPPGETENVTYEVEIRSATQLLPAAWQPVSVDESVTDRTQVRGDGELIVEDGLEAGDSFEVTSAVSTATPQELVNATQDYPTSIRERYTQLPASTPDRVSERTALITQNADNPYETALVIEDWIETNREYSLDIERPDGDIADAMLFEMEAGYCTYFATTMVAMLRSEGIPARMAVGYTPGEQVAEDEWLVRGLNSHAWVEVYFPDIGWVAFDPTPSEPRQAAEQEALAAEGSGGGGGSSGPGTQDQQFEEDNESGTQGAQAPLPSEVAAEGGAGDDLVDPQQQEELIGIEDEGSAAGTADTGGSGIPLPSRERIALGGLLLVGLTAWARQSGIATQVARTVAIRFQRRRDPAADVERAYERLLWVLEERYRPRETGETIRQYLDDIRADSDVRRVVELREKARYADDITETDADEALELVERIRTDT